MSVVTRKISELLTKNDSDFLKIRYTSAQNYLMLMLVLVLLSCAQVRSISGGEKDVVPPQVVMASPSILSTNFSEKEFSIQFDEFISLNNIGQELIVSPPLKKKPTVSLKGKTVRVGWDEDLEPNTTYTFNFGDAIADVHEGNKAEQLVYVFATGNQIDSLSIRGRVNDAYSGTAMAGVKIMLYKDMDTAHVYHDQPSYFTKSRTDGTFTIPYLKAGEYQVVALEDEDSDYHLSEGEAFAFHYQAVSPTRDNSLQSPLFFKMSKMIPADPDINNYSVDSSGVLGFRWMRSFGAPALRIPGDVSTFTSQFLPGKDSVIVYLTGDIKDAYVPVEISKGQQVIDTLDVPFFRTPSSREVQLRLDVGKQHPTNKSIGIIAKEWLIPGQLEMIHLLEDSMEVEISILPDNATLNRYIIDYQTKEGVNYELNILPGAFKNLAGSTNDTLIQTFKTFNKDDLGVVILDFVHQENEAQMVLEIFRKDEIIFQKKGVPSNGSITCESIVPGEYFGRIYLDSNNNDRWDPAHYGRGLQAEQIWNLEQKMNVRGNWEVKILWEIVD